MYETFEELQIVPEILRALNDMGLRNLPRFRRLRFPWR